MFSSLQVTFLALLCGTTITVLAAPIPRPRSLAIVERDAAVSQPLRRDLGDAFRAKDGIQVSALYTAVKSATKKPISDTYKTGHGGQSTIYNDWSGLTGDDETIYTFIADMDIDCDGAGAEKCDPGLKQGSTQRQTSFGALDSTQVPWFVIPDSFTGARKSELKPNALGAVICGSKMFYAIYGDEMGASSQFIGEGSIALARACFGEGKVDANHGHDTKDVAYIVFGKQVPKGVGEKTISLDSLKELGDEQVTKLQQKLNLGSTKGSTEPPDN